MHVALWNQAQKKSSTSSFIILVSYRLILPRQAMYDVVLNNRKLDLEIAKLETELLYKKNKGIEMSNQVIITVLLLQMLIRGKMDVLLEKTCEVTLDSARKVVDSSSKRNFNDNETITTVWSMKTDFYFHLDSSSELTTKHVTSEIARVSRHLNSMTDALSCNSLSYII